MKLQIFISYRRDGGSEKAELIKNILTRNNIPLRESSSILIVFIRENLICVFILLFADVPTS